MQCKLSGKRGAGLWGRGFAHFEDDEADVYFEAFEIVRNEKDAVF
jgi:hypothetical protein